ncbi:MAG: hypothetical protein M1826_001234 [Phylliscum demangeonii]|nr:MAG: hypothetical protein M1826_001234 [Phylliscum demangeonii]
MSPMRSSLGIAFLGGLQASVSVLLTIAYGVVATQFGILRDSSAQDISKLCVRMFLPALLVSSVGSQLSTSNVLDYVPVMLWAMTYTFLSLGLGVVATKLFHFPSWATPALAFNNTISMPLVLIQALDATGILSRLVNSPDDSTSAAILRARSYFLVCSMIGSSLTFAVGPKLLDGELAPDLPDDAHKHGAAQSHVEDGHGRGRAHEVEDDDNDERVDEHTSLLPDVFNRNAHHAMDVGRRRGQQVWDWLPATLQTVLHYLGEFLVAPVLGAIIGSIIGLAPALRRLFFARTTDGGYFSAWLTTSVQNVGDLFAVLQLVVVGCNLSGSLRNMKQRKDSGVVPWAPALFVFAVRFVLWPLISIPVIWALASKTNLLGNDPMLWFCLMLMPTGPPAIKLTALADVNESSEHEKMSIAKFLTIAYCVSPVICFAVVGALRATESLMDK